MVDDNHQAERVAAQLKDVWQALVALGEQLSEDQWAQPTGCPGWSVKDQYSHMIGTESMLAGRSAPQTDAPMGPHVRNPIGQFNEAWVQVRRAASGPEVLAEFSALCDERLRSVSSMTQEQLDTPGPSPVGQVPYKVFMDVRTMDCWIHEQDVRQALDLEWRFDGPSADMAVQRIAMTFPFAVGKKVAPPEGTTVALEVTGPVAFSTHLKMVDGRARPAQEGDTPATTLKADSRAWMRLSTGRLTPAQALSSGDLVIEGDQQLGAKVAAELNQIP